MPLRGVRVLELAGLAPAPFCGMILADFGASVIRVDKLGPPDFIPDALGNGKRSIAIDLKCKKGANILKEMTKRADVLIDPFRKGVMERMQLGPTELLAVNERLIYARLTGYGQDGCYSDMAGHDINYIGLSGLLSLFGRFGQKPTPPANVVADFGGGGLMCALGIVMALLERTKSNRGQVIDSSMVEGSAYLGSWIFRNQKAPFLWQQPRGKNIFDTGAHFYETYETKDSRYMCVGAVEPKFYKVFLEKLGYSEEELPHYRDAEENKAKLEETFKRKTQEEWCAIFDGSDACVTPVLSVDEAPRHPHNRQREAFAVVDDTVIPKAAPRLSRTPGKTTGLLPQIQKGEHTQEILSEFEFTAQEIDEFISDGVVYQGGKTSKL